MADQFTSVDEYIATFPPDVQAILQKVRATIRKAAPELPTPGGVAPFFHRSLEMGQANLTVLVEEARRSVGWTAAELREYFTENISYNLGGRERESLALFYEKAVRHGLAPAEKSLSFL